MALRVLGIVPAWAGSKGVPGKNLRPLAGRSLIEYVAEVARDSNRLDRVILSTDSEDIASVGRAAGVGVLFLRSAALAVDDTPMLPVIQHAVESLSEHGWDAEIVVLLQPTSPLRRAIHVDNAVAMLIETKVDSVVTVVEVPRHLSSDYVMR